MSAFVFLRHDDVTLTLLGVAAVIVVARLAGLAFERLRQPPVVGEVIAGILLGPTILGSSSEALFPLDARPLLKLLATLGLICFMFLIGLELNLSGLIGRQRMVAGVAVLGQAIPFGSGLLLAVILHERHDDADFWPFALFMGAAMAITAFPVLVRILRERKLDDKPLGVTAIACAAADDILTWIILALVVAIASSSGAWDLPYVAGLSIAFFLFMLKVVRPWLQRYAARTLNNTSFSLVIVGIFTCAYITSAIGIHEIFGAFLLGAMFPRGDSRRGQAAGGLALTRAAARLLRHHRLERRRRRHRLDRRGELALVVAVACTGKLIGAVVGARMHGMAMREALALGVLMNTRGLTELVVINIGRDLGIVDDRLFTVLVLMAVATTVATSPVLGLIKPDPYLGDHPSGDAANPEPLPTNRSPA